MKGVGERDGDDARILRYGIALWGLILAVNALGVWLILTRAVGN